MNPELIERFKQQLNAEQSRLESLLGRTSKHLYRREEPYSADFAEQAVEVQNNEVVEQIDRDAQAELLLISKALMRIEQGEFGLCTNCGNEINNARLEAIPQTAYCIKCAV